ncbi:MAG: hypothetical protein M1817_001411 [Caeruleum heppii]|nr:MAG: hypothetical protein M1817_001411 [Caeruleum heppii]
MKPTSLSRRWLSTSFRALPGPHRRPPRFLQVTLPTATSLHPRRGNSSVAHDARTIEIDDDELLDQPPIRDPSHHVSNRDRIHILGGGKDAQFIGHALAGIPNRPPITFVHYTPDLDERWRAHGEVLKMTRHGATEQTRGFDLETGRLTWRSARPKPPLPVDSPAVISRLIVTTGARQCQSFLRPLQHRLNRDSTILFLCDGMGFIEELIQKLFSRPETRPTFMIGLNTHGVESRGDFHIGHLTLGTLSVSVVPHGVSDTGLELHRLREEPRSFSTQHLLRTLTRVPILGAVIFNRIEHHQLLLEQLAISAIVEPLTALMNCLNGELLYNEGFSRTMHLLIGEISLVIRSLPELRHIPNVEERFAARVLRTRVAARLEKTAVATSRTLNHFRWQRIGLKGNKTEGQYLNGYFVRRGEEMGMKCVMNYMIWKMVEGKEQMMATRVQNAMTTAGQDAVDEDEQLLATGKPRTGQAGEILDDDDERERQRIRIRRVDSSLVSKRPMRKVPERRADEEDGPSERNGVSRGVATQSPSIDEDLYREEKTDPSSSHIHRSTGRRGQPQGSTVWKSVPLNKRPPDGDKPDGS